MSSRKPLESYIEGKVVEYAKQRGCLVRKMNGMGFRSWPDRLFITERGVHFYIEFKREGEKGTAAQEQMVDDLAARGVHAIFCDNIAGGRHYVDEMCGTLPREEY